MTDVQAEARHSVVRVRDQSAVAIARQRGRELARRARLSPCAVEAVATAISELAQNLVDHAGGGEVVCVLLNQHGQSGIEVTARDDGPGIADPERAMQDGYSSGSGLGLGLSSAKRLMDDFELVTQVGHGTIVKLRKWAKEEPR
jgi:serine/threonine-protein kinase RsbT